ncbi:hypothetical protein ACLOJK_037106, partial [Asimina triloba]
RVPFRASRPAPSREGPAKSDPRKRGRRMRQLGPGRDEVPGQLPAHVTSRTVVRTGRAACRWKRRVGTYVVGSCSAAGAGPQGPNIAVWRSNGATLGQGAVWLRELSSANLT